MLLSQEVRTIEARHASDSRFNQSRNLISKQVKPKIRLTPILAFVPKVALSQGQINIMPLALHYNTPRGTPAVP